MLDIKKIRDDFEEIKKRVEYRGKGDFGIENVRGFDDRRRGLLAEVEAMKHRQNTVSREIPKSGIEGATTHIPSPGRCPLPTIRCPPQSPLTKRCSTIIR